MNRISFFIIFGFVLLLLSCEGDEIFVTLTSSQDSYNISIAGLPETITAPAGVTRAIPFSVNVKNADGSAAYGKDVTLNILQGAGSVQPLTATTDDNGRIDASFSVILPSGETTTRLSARIDGTEVSRNILLTGTNRPFSVSLFAETNTLVLSAEQKGCILLEGVVADEEGVGVSGARVRFWLTPYGEGHIFGSVSGDRYTDADGHAQAVFSTNGGFGEIRVRFEVDEAGLESELVATQYLNIKMLQEMPRFFSISSFPEILDIVKPDSAYTSLIKATVRDENNIGIANLMLEFETMLGTLSRPTLTDSSGTANVVLTINPTNDLDMEDQSVEITASLPATGWTGSTSVQLLRHNYDTATLTIEPDRRYIWADGPGKSRARIRCILVDGDGQVLTGKSIRFRSSFPYSMVQSPMLTDSLGNVLTYFDDVGRPSVDPVTGQPDSVTVTAEFMEQSLTASVKIMIRERAPVTDIYLRAGARQLISNSGDTTGVQAVCTLVDGSPAPEGTTVHFEAIYGTFTYPIVEITGTGGIANTGYIAGNQVTTDTLIAFIWTPQDTAYSNEVQIDLVAGPPAIMVIRANPREIISHGQSRITATVMDTSGNPVEAGAIVSFSSTFGRITPLILTDRDGDAVTIFTAGLETGTVEITASVEGINRVISAQTTVEIISETPSVIELSASPIVIRPRGMGGVSSSLIMAVLKDHSGNIIDGERPVTFRLINVPESPSGPDFDAEGQVITVATQDGVATTRLFAGIDPCSALIRAFVLGENEQDTVSASVSVPIVGGPPVRMDMDIDETGVDVGGGGWEIELAVRIYDSMGNPVVDGIPVTFQVEPEGIIESVTTGNNNRRGSSNRGTAYGRIIYNGALTFNEVTVTASVQSREDVISTVRVFQYPLQRGELTLNVDPENWMFDEDNPEAIIRCRAVLRDGHGGLINNAPIRFTSNRARFSWLDYSNDQLIAYFPDVVRKHTGVVDRQNDEDPGVATVYLRAEDGDVFLDPFTQEVNVQINASVEGYNDVSAEPGFVLFTRQQ